jgi:low affinity Fe/Cu permease
VRSRRERIGLVLAVALLAAVVGAGIGRTINGSVDFHFVLSCMLLALLFLLHRLQRRNNRVIRNKLDELMDRKKTAPKKVP